VVERSPAQLREESFDVVVLQRPQELELVRQWTGRTPGRDVPAIYLEHNAPEPHPVNSRHALADRTDIPIVHVTHFNQLFWDNGRARSTVIEHGVPDPGLQYIGDYPHSAVVINEPGRRGRMVGADLLAELAQDAPIDLFGMGGLPATAGVHQLGDVPQARMHAELAHRRLYLHPVRWTSLGLSLIEAMHLGMPVVALATTEVAEAVPPGAGVVSTDVDVLAAALAELVADRARAEEMGAEARAAALARYGLQRFLGDWETCLAAAAPGTPQRRAAA
jgi:hypothetical protein